MRAAPFPSVNFRPDHIVVEALNQAALAEPAVLAQLHAQGALRGDPGLVRLMIFGALNWTVQWYDPQRTATLDDLADTAMALFLAPSTVPDPILPTEPTEQHP